MRIDLKVSKEGVVRLETKHVDGVSTLVEELNVGLHHQLPRVVQKGLRIQRVGIEIERQNRLTEDTVQPESRRL